MSRRTDIRAALQTRLEAVPGVKAVCVKRRPKGQAVLPELALVDDSEALDDETLRAQNSVLRFTVVAATKAGSDDVALAALDELIDGVITTVHAQRGLGLNAGWAVRAAVTQADIEHDASEEGAVYATITITVTHRRA